MNKFENSNFFSNYNKKELITLIALLKSLPQNHGKNIRLEEIQKEILKTENFENNPVDYKKIKEYLLENYSYHHLEDPPENLFTENIMTPLGNMVVFPGLTEGQVYILQSLINVLANENPFSDDFNKEALGQTFFMLTISNLICSSLNYKRNLSHVNVDSNDIYFPNEKYIYENLDNFIFTKDYFEYLYKKFNIDNDLIENFILNTSLEDFKSNDVNENPIIFKPIIKIDNHYLIVSPTNFVFAIVFNIYHTAIKYKCFDALIKQLSLECWKQCNFILENFGYNRIKFDFVQTSLPIYEGLFIFDTDKLAYVTYHFDDGKDFDSSFPLTPYLGEDVLDKITEHKKRTYNSFINNEDLKKFEIFDFNITLLIGRPKLIGYKILNKESNYLGARMDELVILHKSGKLNNLTLYNFAQAKSKINLINPSFLDNLSVFIGNDESFYLDDNHRVDNLFFEIGNALTFKTESIQKNDVHVGIYPFNESFIFLPVERETFPATLPIYKTIDVGKFSEKILSRAFDREIWIEPVFKENDNKQFSIEICIAIAFWFNEIGSNLSSLLKLNKIKPLLIKIEFDYIEDIQLEFGKLDNSKDPFEQITYFTNDNEITIKLNAYFYKVTYRNDNLGERLLIKRILYILSQIYDDDKRQVLELNFEEIDFFLEKYMPINQKKKILFQISDMDIRNNPNNLIKYTRGISSYHVNMQLDDVCESLGYSNLKKEIIFEGIEKEKLLKQIIDNFECLIKNTVSKFDFEDILLKLLSFYELIIFKREHAKFELMPKIECFKNHCDIEKVISKEIQKNNQISLSVRCLIEYIIDNPPNGTIPFDSNKFDECIALMSNIINWGFMYDEHIFNITDTSISILKSGRLGTSKDFRNLNFEPFYQEKFKEDILDYSNEFINKNFKLSEINTKSHEVVEKNEYELVFEEEFEVDYNDYINVIFESGFLAFENERSIMSSHKKSFISTLSKKLNIGFDKIEKIINTFSIKVNDSNQINFFDSENNQNYPWRFNRKKSLLQKPFIIRKVENEEKIYFGARALYDSFVSLHGIISSGRFNSDKTKMRSFLSKINKEKGDEFNDELFNLVKSKLNCLIIDKEVTIGPKKTDILLNEKDLGDFDILLVDNVLSKIVCIESKNTNFARTPYEMNREINNFIKKSDKGWIQKVEKREQWLIENKNSLKVLANTIDYSNFTIEYVFVTKEAIPLSFIKDINYRFLTMYDIRNNPLILFDKNIK